MGAPLGNRRPPTSVMRSCHLPPVQKLDPSTAGRGITGLHCWAHATIQAHGNGCVRRTAIYACALGNYEHLTSGVRARYLPPARELAPWSARRGATDLHGGAQARIQACIQARVNGCVRRTATYACGVWESHTSDLGRERSPLAAGSGTRPLVKRGLVRRPALRGSGKNTGTRKRMRNTYSNLCVRHWGIAHAQPRALTLATCRRPGNSHPGRSGVVRPLCVVGLGQEHKLT